MGVQLVSSEVKRRSEGSWPVMEESMGVQLVSSEVRRRSEGSWPVVEE
jgi:hypothetical protein